MKRVVALLLGLLVAAGCGGKRETVTGKVTYRGQSVGNVALHLYPIDGKGPDLTVPVTQDGTFRTTGVTPGEYKVVVSPPAGDDMAAKMKNMRGPKTEEARKILEQNKSENKTTVSFPQKYQNIVTSDLKCTVSGGQQEINLDMKD